MSCISESDYSPVINEVPQEKFLRSSWLALRKSTLVRQRLAEDKAIKTLFAPREITHIFISYDSGDIPLKTSLTLINTWKLWCLLDPYTLYFDLTSFKEAYMLLYHKVGF